MWMKHLHVNKKSDDDMITGLKLLGRVGTYIVYIFFSRKKYNIICILKGISPFSENLKSILGFTSKFR